MGGRPPRSTHLFRKILKSISAANEPVPAGRYTAKDYIRSADNSVAEMPRRTGRESVILSRVIVSVSWILSRTVVRFGLPNQVVKLRFSLSSTHCGQPTPSSASFRMLLCTMPTNEGLTRDQSFFKLGREASGPAASPTVATHRVGWYSSPVSHFQARNPR